MKRSLKHVEHETLNIWNANKKLRERWGRQLPSLRLKMCKNVKEFQPRLKLCTLHEVDVPTRNLGLLFVCGPCAIKSWNNIEKIPCRNEDLKAIILLSLNQTFSNFFQSWFNVWRFYWNSKSERCCFENVNRITFRETLCWIVEFCFRLSRKFNFISGIFCGVPRYFCNHIKYKIIFHIWICFWVHQISTPGE